MSGCNKTGEYIIAREDCTYVASLSILKLKFLRSKRFFYKYPCDGGILTVIGLARPNSTAGQFRRLRSVLVELWKFLSSAWLFQEEFVFPHKS